MGFMANCDVGNESPNTELGYVIRGLRSLQIRVPDTPGPEFAEEAHRQSGSRPVEWRKSVGVVA